MMDERFIDEILDNLIKEAGPVAVEKMTKEDLENIDKPVFEFSKEHEEKMKQIFKDVKNGKDNIINENEKTVGHCDKKSNGFSTSKKIILVAAVLATLTFGALISTSGAYRGSFVDMFLTQKEEYSDVNYRKTNGNYKFKNVWFKYIPEEYECTKNKTGVDESLYTFEIKDKKYITLNLQNKGIVPQINTESGDVSEVVLRNKDMVYSEKEDMRMLTWIEQGKLVALCTNDSKSTLFKVGENIIFIEGESQ